MEEEKSKEEKFVIKPYSNTKKTEEKEPEFKLSSPTNKKDEYKQPEIYQSQDFQKERQRPRDDRTTELKPQVQSVAKHWYDEYPIEDRRKQLEESIKRRKERLQQEEQYKQEDLARRQEYDNPRQTNGLNQNNVFTDNHEITKNNEFIQSNGFTHNNRASQEIYRDRSFDHPENKFEFHKSPNFEKDEFNEVSATKYYSRSCNRNTEIHKRSFVNPSHQKREKEVFNPSNLVDQRQFGKSASHGIGRNYRQPPAQQPSFKQYKEIVNKCDIQFNTDHVNYDMSEIELPAYCKNHPDGKLLYIITPLDQESELGCVYCALEINQNRDK